MRVDSVNISTTTKLTVLPLNLPGKKSPQAICSVSDQGLVTVWTLNTVMASEICMCVKMVKALLWVCTPDSCFRLGRYLEGMEATRGRAASL
jgi:hypothetical protein